MTHEQRINTIGWEISYAQKWETFNPIILPPSIEEITFHDHSNWISTYYINLYFMWVTTLKIWNIFQTSSFDFFENNFQVESFKFKQVRKHPLNTIHSWRQEYSASEKIFSGNFRKTRQHLTNSIPSIEEKHFRFPKELLK